MIPRNRETDTAEIPHTIKKGSFLRILKDSGEFEDVPIREGQIVKITVPHKRIHKLLCENYDVDFNVPNEWEIKDYFLLQAWKAASELIQMHEQETFNQANELFKDKAAAVTTKQYRLSDMYKNDYPQESIDALVMEIEQDYGLLLGETSENFFTRRYIYGTHFKLGPEPIIVPKERPYEIFSMNE